MVGFLRLPPSPLYNGGTCDTHSLSPSLSLLCLHVPFPFLCADVPVSPCLHGFPCFVSIFLSQSAFFTRSKDTQMTWSSARPRDSKAARSAWRDSIDTVSPRLARCRLQRDGRPGLESWGKTWHHQMMEPMLKCKQSSSIWHLRLRREGAL